MILGQGVRCTNFFKAGAPICYSAMLSVLSLDVARQTQLGRVPRFALCRSCWLTLHVAGGLRQESDWSRQYHLWCSLVVVMLTFCLLRRLQHADIHTLHTVGLPVVADQSLSKSRPGVSLGGISGGDTSGSGLRSCMHSMGHPLRSPSLLPIFTLH